MKFLVFDAGLYVDHANALSNKGKNKVRYCTSIDDPFPDISTYSPGKNFEYLEKVIDCWKHVDESDCIVNFDCTNQGVIEWLRNKYPNKSVFGCGAGEKLEHNRWGFRKLQKQLGLPTQHTERVKGITALREHLKKNPNKYVKTDIFRKHLDSFYCKSYDLVKEIIDERAIILGGLQEDVYWLIEDPIDTPIEVGFDGFFNGKKFLDKCIYGYELGKESYIGKVGLYKDLPVPIKESLDKLTPVMQQLNYRGMVSTEEKVKSPIQHYFLDFCARGALPLTAMYSEYIKNFDEVVYKCGKGEDVQVDIPYKYVAACPLGAKHAEEYDTRLVLDKKDRDKVKLQIACCSPNGDYYAVKGHEGIATLISHGNTPKECIEGIKKANEKIDCYGKEDDSINKMSEIERIIKDGIKVGISF